MQINDARTKLITGAGADKLRVVVDGSDRADVDSLASRDLARAEASKRGFGDGGMCDQPTIGPIGPDDQILDGMDALDPAAEVRGFRAEYMFAHKA